MTDSETSPAPMYSHEFHVNPFPTYAQMRAAGPVHRIRDPNSVDQWFVVRYEEARAALSDSRLSRDPRFASEALRKSGIYEKSAEEESEANMLNMDPPDHTRLRKIVARAFTPRRIEQLRPWVQRITDELLDTVASCTRFDLIEALATPLPVTVACALLGVPVTDSPYLQELSTALLTPAYAQKATMPSYEAGRRLLAYFADLVPVKMKDVIPGAGINDQPDLMCALIEAAVGQQRLNEKELIATAMLLLVGGFETTAGLIGIGTYTLLREPGQLALLRARPELFPSAIDEFIRYDGPAERSMIRVATQDIELGGVTIPKGGIVTVALSATSRDPAHFTDPDRLDVTRSDRSHLGFGHGVHFCIGAPLARLEGEIAIRTLFTRFPGIALDCAPDQLPWREIGVMRGLERLPLRR